MPGLIALALAYVFSQLYRSFLSVITPQLTAELGMDKADLSLAAGIWFISFSLMQFVVGPALDRFGRAAQPHGYSALAPEAAPCYLQLERHR